MKTLCSEVRRIRSALIHRIATKGYTQKQIADEVGMMDTGYLNHFLKGKRTNIGLELYLNMCNFIDKTNS